MTGARVIVLVAASLLAACDRNDTNREHVDSALAQSRDHAAARAASDPARRPHPDDPNPLRRKLGDLDIRELFFGPSQTRGDWRAWRPCSQQANGLKVAAADQVMLSRCAALRGDLLAKAKAAGVPEATAENVLDPQLSGAVRGTLP
ncbi:MAG: hypothetical protein NVS9B10_26420 [Nevskia sp.]